MSMWLLINMLSRLIVSTQSIHTWAESPYVPQKIEIHVNIAHAKCLKSNDSSVFLLVYFIYGAPASSFLAFKVAVYIIHFYVRGEVGHHNFTRLLFFVIFFCGTCYKSSIVVPMWNADLRGNLTLPSIRRFFLQFWYQESAWCHSGTYGQFAWYAN